MSEYQDTREPHPTPTPTRQHILHPPPASRMSQTCSMTLSSTREREREREMMREEVCVCERERDRERQRQAGRREGGGSGSKGRRGGWQGGSNVGRSGSPWRVWWAETGQRGGQRVNQAVKGSSRAGVDQTRRSKGCRNQAVCCRNRLGAIQHTHTHTHTHWRALALAKVHYKDYAQIPC